WDGGYVTSAGSLLVNSTLTTSAFENTGAITINNGGVLTNLASPLTSGGGSHLTINSGGTLNVSANALDLNGALLVNNGTITGPTNVNFGSLAKGSGVYGAVNVTDGGRFSPGNSPGSVTTGSTTWNAGGAYTVEIADALAGPGVGWDLWDIVGDLLVNGSGHFSIDLVSLSGAGPGTAANFDPAGDYHWLIARSSNDLGQIDLRNLEIDSTSFTNATANGQFSISNDATGIYINFSDVPEPSASALIGAVGLFLVRRRRQ